MGGQKEPSLRECVKEILINFPFENKIGNSGKLLSQRGHKSVRRPSAGSIAVDRDFRRDGTKGLLPLSTETVFETAFGIVQQSHIGPAELTVPDG